jgi:hypothetical protein
MGRGDEAEKQVGRLMLLPFLDLHFTQVGEESMGHIHTYALVDINVYHGHVC